MRHPCLLRDHPLVSLVGTGEVGKTMLAFEVGRFDPNTGVITEFEIPTANSMPFGIDHGRDIWFAEGNPAAPKIGRLHVDRFIDDDTNIFENAIEWLAAQGITQGCGPGLYCPDDFVTRGQMAAFLHRALG